MLPISIRHSFRPVRRSLSTGRVADLFGIGDEEADHIVADNVALDVRPGDLVLFSGPSGSGKSSLLRAAATELGAIDAMGLELPKLPLIDALTGPFEERLNRLSACGLSEARLLLRTPAELSDGQRYRFRLAYALGLGAPALAADEFAAYLDRTLARVVAFNLRKLITRSGTGLLVATTHDDLTADLRPDLHVRCYGDGIIRQYRDESARASRPISFNSELRIEEGTRADWPAFAKWHYRSHSVGFVRRVVLLKHGREPIGICVFAAPAASLALRTQYFGLSGQRTRLALQALNEQLWLLARVVIHPTYRGAGLAADFVRRACESCPTPWIETLSAMGHANPFFERAGFRRVGIVRKPARPARYGGQFGTTRFCSRETIEKSQHSEPLYYVFDNRKLFGLSPNAESE